MAFTKRAVNIFAGYTSGGQARQINNDEAQVWGTEVETTLDKKADLTALQSETSARIGGDQQALNAVTAEQQARILADEAILDDLDEVRTIAQVGMRPMLAPVRLLVTTNVNIANALENGDTLDGETLVTGDRVALAGQSTGSQNGVYVVPASGAASRASDADTSDELIGARFEIYDGTHAGEVWGVKNTSAITVGSTAISIGQFLTANPVAAEVIAGRLGEASLADAIAGKADIADVEGSIAASVRDGCYIDFVGGTKIVRDVVAGTTNASALVGDGITFTRSGTKKVVGPSGKMVVVSNDIPAIVYDNATRRARGLLLEDAVESVLKTTHYQSGLTAPERWVSNGLTTLATASVPGAEDSGNTATKIICSTTATPHRITYESAPVDNAEIYVYEALVRRETVTAGGVWILRSTGTAVGVRFMWDASGVPIPTVTHGTPIDYGAVKASDSGFWRLWMAFTTDATTQTINLAFTDTTGSQAHTNADEWHHDGSWLYKGRGLRTGPYNSGSIGSTPRDTMTATPSTIFPRLGPAGAFRLRVGPWSERESGNLTFFQIHNSGGSERILIRNGTVGLGQVYAQVTNAAATTFNLLAGLNLQDGFDITVAWSPDGVQIYLGGSLVNTAALVLDMKNANTTYIGANASSAATTNALFRDLRYWPYAITDEELSGASGESFRVETRDGHRVIVNQAGSIISDPDSDVTGMGLQESNRLVFASNQYGPVLSYVQMTTGTTSVLCSHRRRLLLYCALGQSLSIGSSTAPGDMVFTSPLHAPVVSMFPIGPQGPVSATLTEANLNRLLPAQSVEYLVSSNVKDTPIIGMGYKAAHIKRKASIYELDPITVTSVGVGGTALADLMDGGATVSWANLEDTLEAFADRAEELGLTPVFDWAMFNQGEANQNTALATYLGLLEDYIDDVRAEATAATGQTSGPKVVIEQLGSRKTSSQTSGVCEVPLAQAQAAREIDGVYIRPSYWVIHNYSQDESHPDAEGFILNGELSARVSTWVDAWEAGSDTLEGDWIGCRLLSWERSGTTVVLKFNVPLKHLGHKLVYDATSLPAMPKWGIEFLDNGTPITISGDPVITADDEITITLSTTPSGTESVRLGYTNTTSTVTPGGTYTYPGTNIRTSWSQPSAYVPGAILHDWAIMEEVAP